MNKIILTLLTFLICLIIFTPVLASSPYPGPEPSETVNPYPVPEVTHTVVPSATPQVNITPQPTKTEPSQVGIIDFSAQSTSNAFMLILFLICCVLIFAISRIERKI